MHPRGALEGLCWGHRVVLGCSRWGLWEFPEGPGRSFVHPRGVLGSPCGVAGWSLDIPRSRKRSKSSQKLNVAVIAGNSHFSGPKIGPWLALVGFKGSLSALMGSLEGLRRCLVQPRGILEGPFGVTRWSLDVPIRAYTPTYDHIYDYI